MPTPTPTAEELSAALTLLRAVHPKGFSVDADGVLALPRDTVKPKSVAELLALKSAPKRVELDLGASRVEMEVFALAESVTAEFEKKVPTPVPPVKLRKEGGRDVPDGFNREDEKFKAAVDAAYQLRRALTLAAAVPLLGVQGDTPEAMRDWLLAQSFPVHFLDSLYAAAKSMSESPIERASFI